MQLTYKVGDQERSFECFDNWLSKWTCEEILNGNTYPHLPFVDDVQVIMDVGAHCGSTSVYLSTLYPEATIYAFEPGAETYRLLKRNTSELANVRAFNIGLHADDLGEVPLYHGEVDAGTASIHPDRSTGGESEPITLRSATGWLAEQAIDRVDVLKVDTEGCEVPILEGLSRVLAGVKVLYLEFHSEADRRTLDAMLAPTHDLLFGKIGFGAGELVYVERSVLEKAKEAADG
jgi:FkbM family methyltransferase